MKGSAPLGREGSRKQLENVVSWACSGVCEDASYGGIVSVRWGLVQETVGAGGIEIDPNVSNDSLEWYA
jgi:hypothetical protein